MTSPWLNETTRAKRRAWRQAERRWKKDRLQISLEMLRESQKAYHRAVKTERDNYFATLISNNTHNTRVLFRTINSVVHPPPTAIQDPSPVKCEEFLTFFSEKVETIRRNIPLSTRDLNISLGGPSTFTKFEPISLSFLTEIVSSLRSVSSPLDPIPAPLLKEVFNTLGPHILTIVNSSLVTGTVPSALKQAVVHPLIKKPSLDPTILSNYRPISKLPFLSKILEKAVLSQLSPYLTNNDILEKFQSGFRARHSTESALLKVLNDLLLIVDTGKCAALVLLDLSAAFDTVDHSILISRPQQGAGITNTALSWFKSYLSNRTYSVSLANFSSHQSTLTCGVPQGSILAPILFNLYMLPLSQIITRHNVSFHCYADDTQIYLPLTTDVPTSLTRLKTCLEDIKDWMAQNHLQLNESKGEIILFGTSTSVTQISTSLGTLSPLVKPTVKNLGVMFDSDLTFKPQVRAVVQSCFFSTTHHRQNKILPLPQQPSDSHTYVHLFTPGQLQRPLLWTARQNHPTPPAGAECSRQASLRRQKEGPYFTNPKIAPLAPCKTEDHIQDPDLCLQSHERPRPSLPLRTPDQIVQLLLVPQICRETEPEGPMD